MILGFKKKFPWGDETNFMQKILACVPVDENNRQASPGNMFQSFTPKIHTVRIGDRIKPGTRLHMATGVRTSQYFCFNEGIKELEYCKSIQHVWIYSQDRVVLVATQVPEKGGKIYTWNFVPVDVEVFATNDGFNTVEDFWKWFHTDTFGSIIHWTDKVY